MEHMNLETGKFNKNKLLDILYLLRARKPYIKNFDSQARDFKTRHTKLVYFLVLLFITFSTCAKMVLN